MNRGNLRYLLNPRSIVVIGASERNFYSGNAIRRLLEGGYSGRVYLVNPNRSSVFGERCFRSVSEIPDRVDHALVAVGRERVMGVLADCLPLGTQAAVVLASGYAERRDARSTSLQQQLRSFGEKSGLAMCGPNCLGVINAHDNFASFGGHQGVPIIPGNIGVVSQSGATLHYISEAAYDRNLGFSYLISSGNEACLEASEYIDFMVDDDRTEVICGFIESFKEPRRFVQVAERALAKGKPLIIVKIGRSEKGRRLALAHTGALTGHDRNYDAVFRQTGVIRAYSIDDLLDKCSLFAQLPKSKWPKHEGLGIISVSGGSACLIGDLSESHKLKLPDLPLQVVNNLREVLPPEITVQNPLELPGRVSRNDRNLWATCAKQFVAQPNLDALVAILGLSERHESALLSLASVASTVDTPVILSSVAARALSEEARQLSSIYHLPMVFGIEPCLKALKTVIDYNQFRTRRVGDIASTRYHTANLTALAMIKDWATGVQIVDEYKTKKLLSSYGISIALEHVVRSVEEAIRTADEIGYPIALKLLSRNIIHKTEINAIRLNIRDNIELKRAYNEIWSHALTMHSEVEIDGMLVQEMVSGVTEIYIGVVFDSELGVIIFIGLGGVLVELMDDISARIAPITKVDAEDMIMELRGYKLLTGFREKPKADISALIDALLKVSQLAVDLSGYVSELDINPLIVLEEGRGVKVVDTLLVLHRD
ncbi:MAG: acetate--CoA ligase family protein [Ardenticatenaceae bacterium]|nr:acetate--CoA ligase family protein [Ardenticatenaceae bacterium]